MNFKEGAAAAPWLRVILFLAAPSFADGSIVGVSGCWLPSRCLQPAFWTMGNLGRAGYMESTAGMWPYSYDTCEGSGKQLWSGLDGQLITACPTDPPGVDRAAWGLNPGQGRGAPEFDVFEVA